MDFFRLVINLVLIMNPVGAIPFLLSFIKALPDHRRKNFILCEAFAALVTMCVFLFCGKQLLLSLHLTHNHAKFAGGIYLFFVALKICFPKPGGIGQSFGLKAGEVPFLVPLAIPMLAGPGLLAKIIDIASVEGTSVLFNFAAVVVTGLSATLLLLLALPLAKFLCDKTVALIEKVVGLLLLLMSVGTLEGAVSTFLKEQRFNARIEHEGLSDFRKDSLDMQAAADRSPIHAE